MFPSFWNVSTMSNATFDVGKHNNEQFDELIKRYLSLAGKDGLLPKCFVNGDDIEALGIPRGRIYANVLTEIFHKQLEGKIKNRAEALKELKRLFLR